MKTRAREIIYSCFFGLIVNFAGCCSIPSSIPSRDIGCRVVEESPISALSRSTSQLTDDPEITGFYKKCFPDGKPRLFYRLNDDKKFQTEFFIRGSSNSRETSGYNVLFGIELKY